MMDENKLNDAIATTVAKQILETISQEHRDAMLERRTFPFAPDRKNAWVFPTAMFEARAFPLPAWR